jgi:hypothetical protein
LSSEDRGRDGAGEVVAAEIEELQGRRPVGGESAREEVEGEIEVDEERAIGYGGARDGAREVRAADVEELEAGTKAAERRRNRRREVVAREVEVGEVREARD